MTTVAELMVRALEAEGVRYVFGVPGEENEAVLFALEESSIRFVPTRHEQGAAFIANVWGRLTGHAGVCLATLGPGATNLLTGIADAHMDKAPVVAITAQGALSRLHQESHQAIGVVAMLGAVTKWNTTVRSKEVVGEVVRKAFKIAEQEKPGATHIELPEDVADHELDSAAYPVLNKRRVRRPRPDDRALGAAVSALRSAERPLVLAGNGAIRKRASEQLALMATELNLPVVSTFMGKGAISDRLPQSLRTVGLGLRDYVMDAVDAADLLLAVGYDIAELAPERFNPDRDKRIVHIDFEPAEVYSHYQPEIEVIADISATLEAIRRGLGGDQGRRAGDWWHDVRQRIEEDVRVDQLPAPTDGAAEGKMTVPRALRVVREALPDDGLILSDVGSHKLWVARNFPVYVPNGCIISNGLASMGIALPGAIAASMVAPGRSVVSCMGDGGALMNIQELETAARVGANFVAIVFNDDDYGLISWKQRRRRGRSVSTRIGNPDFVHLARAFGVKAARVETEDALAENLREALANRELRLIEVPVDPRVNDSLADRLSKLTTTTSRNRGEP